MGERSFAGKCLPWQNVVILVVIALMNAGCAIRPSSAVLIPVASDAKEGKTVSILAATTRARSDNEEAAFTNERARTVSYAQYAISLPPHHVAGKIEWPSQTPGNPQKDFVVTNERMLDKTGFKEAIARQLALKKTENGNVLVFVHGYNTSYQEAVFRLAQLTGDRSYEETTVLFAWPSRAMLTGYGADRESSTYSRDYLEQTLDDIASIPNVKTVNLVAHSMGNWLAVETLRQAKLRSKSLFLSKLGNVVLLSPDIDIDVFRTQLDVIGKLKHPMIIALSKNDLALAASQRLAGDVVRVGNALIDNPRAQAAIERYDLKVVDLSQINSDDVLGHSNFIQALPELEHIARNEDTSDSGHISAPGIFTVDNAGEILETPLRMSNALLGKN